MSPFPHFVGFRGELSGRQLLHKLVRNDAAQATALDQHWGVERRVFGGIPGAAFLLPFVIVVQVPRELYEPAHSIVAGALEHTIDVSERSGGLIRTASGDDGANAKPLDRFGEQQRGRSDAQPELKVAQNTEYLSRQIVLYDVRVGV